MRKLLFISLLFLFLNKNHAQSNFNSFKLDNVEWFELETVPSLTVSNWRDYYYNFYKICGDSIYNDTLYKKVYFGKVFSPNYQLAPWLVPTAPPSFSFYCFFRQDTLTKSNYYRMPNSVDSLLCSYNLQVGDTLKRGLYANSYKGMGGKFPVIIKTDSIPVEGKKFKIYYTDTLNQANPNSSAAYYCKQSYPGVFLIEGLGTSNGFLYWYYKGWAEYSSNQEDSLSFIATCSLTNGISQYSNLTSQTSIYPNPSTGIFTIETNAGTKQNMQIFDVNGKMVLTQTITGKTNIDASALPAGVYNISLSNNEGVTNKRLLIVR